MKLSLLKNAEKFVQIANSDILLAMGLQSTLLLVNPWRAKMPQQ